MGGDTFRQHETWLAVSTSNSAKKMILRASNKMVFFKPKPLFASKIISTCEKEMRIYFETWTNAAKQRGFFIPTSKPTIQLSLPV